MITTPDLEVTRGLTLISDDRLRVLWWAVKQTLSLPGMRIECGVYKGGSAKLIAAAADPFVVDLYDTFTGIPDADERHDKHKRGDFADTSVEAVRAALPKTCQLHPGFIPDTLNGKEYPVAFAHIDLDQYNATHDALWNVYRRMKRGGIIVLDDFGWPDTPGVTEAVDEFLADKPEVPLVAAPFQCLIVKL